MAGSFSHCDVDGGFRFDSIENLGDAYEACHMMHWMIHHLTGGDAGKIADAEDAYFADLRCHGYRSDAFRRGA